MKVSAYIYLYFRYLGEIVENLKSKGKFRGWNHWVGAPVPGPPFSQLPCYRAIHI